MRLNGRVPHSHSQRTSPVGFAGATAPESAPQAPSIQAYKAVRDLRLPWEPAPLGIVGEPSTEKDRWAPPTGRIGVNGATPEWTASCVTIRLSNLNVKSSTGSFCPWRRVDKLPQAKMLVEPPSVISRHVGLVEGHVSALDSARPGKNDRH